MKLNKKTNTQVEEHISLIESKVQIKRKIVIEESIEIEDNKNSLQDRMSKLLIFILKILRMYFGGG